MKYAIITLFCAASVAIAADVPVDLGAITVPDAAVVDVTAWLDTQPNLYTNAVSYETRTNPNTGESIQVEIVTPVLVPETAKQKLARLSRKYVLNSLREKIKAFRQSREYATADSTVDAAPDPIAENE